MKLYNTLSRKIEELKPFKAKELSIYSCGPTVYDHIHIGNLSYFIYADILRRALQTSGQDVQHLMNVTDVDDKTIRRSHERYPEEEPLQALKKLTKEYEQIFLADMEAIGNDVNALSFIRATDSIELMQKLIGELYKSGFAYIADDGVYFSIEKYKQSGKKYGQLLELKTANTSAARINNDEYDKDSVHDFALWKLQKDSEPAWEFNLDGRKLLGRPGWHIECSAMSVSQLGQPFDIHTGGVDLIFPHHENEIAQSTAGKKDDYARFFVHNEHLLVDGRKMSKSLNNFYTLQDVKEKGFDPLAFRLLVLQSHYRSQSNFTWENLEAAQNRLKSYRAFADLLWQLPASSQLKESVVTEAQHAIGQALASDLDTPKALALLSDLENQWLRVLSSCDKPTFKEFLKFLDASLGLGLANTQDLTDEYYKLLNQRDDARRAKDWAKSDELRHKLEEQGIGLRDTQAESIWYRL